MEEPEPTKKRKAQEITEDGASVDAEAEKKDDDETQKQTQQEHEQQEKNDPSSSLAADETAEKKEDVKPLTGSNNPAKVDSTAEGAGAEGTAEKVEDSKSSVTPSQTKAKSKNEYDNLRYVIVKNDGKPENLIKLVGLKSLFAKQLPKMPRAYIARLVFDRRHISLAILSEDPSVKDSDEEIIGAICFRPFYDMRFAEIAFCAVNATHQVKVSCGIWKIISSGL